MGSLYLAWDPVLERQIAIKLLREDMEELRERFDREARSVARLRHPNIVTIFDVGEHDGQPFIAMEYIHGQTLAEIIRSPEQPLVSRKLKIVDELCDGLAFAHRMSIIHRDVKPANVMVEDEGAVKVLDFGIARVAESGMTMAGMLIGTLNYMSPEQIGGKVVDNRSDIFAIGAVMYEFLSQRQAFPGGLHSGIINRILYEQPPDLETLCPTLDGEIIEIVRKALEKDPDTRYQDLAAMRRDLQRVRLRAEELDETIVVTPDPNNETVVAERPPERRPSHQGRRGTPPEALAKLRASQLAAHLESSQRALEAGEYDSAISAAEHALLLDPENAAAAEIIDHARAALDEKSVQDLVNRAGQLIEAGALTDAMGLCDQAMTIAPGSPAAAELRKTLDRLHEERERERQRLELVRAATARAQSSLDRGSFEEALSLLEEALHVAPESETASRIRHQAEEGIVRARQEALDQAAERVCEDARRAFETGEHEQAFGILTGFQQQHPHVSQTLEALRSEKARLDREAERVRQQRITDAIASAATAPSHEAALAHLREALEIDPARADVAGLIAERERGIERERAEARLAREREAQIAEGLSRAAGEPSHASAIAILEPLVALGSGREDLREALETRRTALEHEREERRRAEELRRRVDGLLAQAAATAGHEPAIALLREAGALDAGRADIGEALLAREGALERERELRRQEEEREAEARRLAEEREREARRQAEERAARIAAAIARADAIESDEEALGILDAALAVDEGDAALTSRIQARRTALARKQEEARRERERQARIAAATAKAAAARSHEDAIVILTKALGQDPGHPELTRQLEERRGALERWQREERERRERAEQEARERREQEAREARERAEREARARAEREARERRERAEREARERQEREEREARERQEREARAAAERRDRVNAAIAKAKGLASHADAVAVLEQAASVDPSEADLKAALSARQEALAREREEERRQRERQERVATAIRESKKARNTQAALALLKDAQAVAPEHEELRRLVAEAEVTLAREQEAARQLRERQARVAALLAKAKQTDSHERAIELLQEIVGLEPGHRESQALLEKRKSALEQERAAAKRQADLEAARRAFAQAIASRDLDRADAVLKDAERTLAAGKLFKGERARLKQARAAVAHTATGQAVPGMRPAVVGGIAAAAALVLAIGYFAFKSGPDDGAPSSSTPPAAQTQPSTQGQGASPPQAQPPASPAANSPATPSPAPAPAPETPVVTPPPDSKVAGDIKSAQDLLQQGQLQRAADSVARGLRVEPRNPMLRDLGRAVVARARQATADARTRATQNAAAAGSQEFRDAQTRQVEAGRRERSDQYDRAVRLYDEAARLYTTAAATVAAARPEPPPAAEPPKPVVTAPPAAAPPPSSAPSAPPPPPPTAPSTGGSTGSPAGSPAAGGAAAPPPVTEKVPPPVTAKPTPAAPQPPSPAMEEAAIRATLREYAAAYESLRVDAVQRVYPGVNAAGLTRSFRDLSALRVQIGDEQITIEGATAVVRCRVRQAFTPKVGQGRSETVTSTFRLQKTGGRWVIIERR